MPKPWALKLRSASSFFEKIVVVVPATFQDFDKHGPAMPLKTPLRVTLEKRMLYLSLFRRSLLYSGAIDLYRCLMRGGANPQWCTPLASAVVRSVYTCSVYVRSHTLEQRLRKWKCTLSNDEHTLLVIVMHTCMLSVMTTSRKHHLLVASSPAYKTPNVTIF